MIQLGVSPAHSFWTMSCCIANLPWLPSIVLPSSLSTPPSLLTSSVILSCCRADWRSLTTWVHTGCTRGYHYTPCLLLYSARNFWQFSGPWRPPLHTGASVSTQQRDHTWGGVSVCLSDLVHSSGPAVILVISQILNFPFWNFL